MNDDVDIGVANSSHQWSTDWLRYAPSTAWYVDQHSMESGCFIHVEVDFEADRVVFGIRKPGTDLVSFLKEEHNVAVYAAVAIRHVGDSVTIVRARFGEIQRDA